MFNTDARRVCIIDIPPRSGRSTLHGGTGRTVGFPVTLGGFKVDGEGEDGLFRHSHQIDALLLKDRRSVLQFTPVENAVGRTAAAVKF